MSYNLSLSQQNVPRETIRSDNSPMMAISFEEYDWFNYHILQLQNELQHLRNQFEQLRHQSINAQNYFNSFANENKKLHEFIDRA